MCPACSNLFVAPRWGTNHMPFMFFFDKHSFFSLRLPLGEMFYDSFSARLKYSGQHWACTSSAQHPHSPEDSNFSGHWYGIFFYHYDGLCKPGCGRSHLRDDLWLGQVVQLIKRGQLPKFFNCLYPTLVWTLTWLRHLDKKWREKPLIGTQNALLVELSAQFEIFTIIV